MRNKKIILDTNLWISFLISKDYSFLDNYIEKEKVKLIFSSELFSEFISVTERPKLKKYFSEGDVENLIRIINKYGILVDVSTDIDVCRDKKDNFLLNLAIDCGADYLVTGDNDLLVIKEFQNIKIITIKELVKVLSK
ncbi:MAG TPA: putative toxin-antitoxin system toxin component, PIN family [Flavobacterium sp.]|nr:putative toxin-antitoxin system toxin component, PIN family [Flavobacterium sp.]